MRFLWLAQTLPSGERRFARFFEIDDGLRIVAAEHDACGGEFGRFALPRGVDRCARQRSEFRHPAPDVFAFGVELRTLADRHNCETRCNRTGLS